MTIPTQDPSELSAQAPQDPISGTPLPQYGFGSEFSFDSLIQDNPFLFRIYTPKTGSQIFDKTTEPYFVGQKFNEHFTQAAEQLKGPSLAPGESVASVCTYHDVAQHMDWTQRHMSPFISTTFSFAWAIWEATRRYRVGLKHDIEIAVIDARMLSGQAATALELLRKGSPKERHLDYWKWYRYALESQDVLVYGAIPASAVLASISLPPLIDKLPSYFLRQDRDPKSSPPSLKSLSWNTTERKPSFRQFCQDMSAQFLQLSAEHRLRDAAVGSVRLAMAFLRPWFYKAVVKDPSGATDKACTLAFMIAQWPAQWWSRDHLEIWTVIRSLAEAVADEVQKKRDADVSEEVYRLRSVVTGLKHIVDHHKIVEVTSSVDPKKEDVKQYTMLPTPPLSPPPPSTPPPVIQCVPPVPICPTLTTQDVTDPSTDRTTGDDPCRRTVILSPTTIIIQQQQQEQHPSTEKHYELQSSEHGTAESRNDRSHTFVETASCIVTGVLIGAFITLCIINVQRRTLIYVT